MKFRIISTGLVLLAAIACTEEVKVEPFTYPQIFTGLTTKSWSIRTLQFFRDGKPDQPLGLATCALDDIYTFHNNAEKLLVITEGPSRCTSTDPTVIAESSWAFVNTTATFTFLLPILADVPLPYTLTQIDANRFSIEIYRDDTSGFRINFRSVSSE